MAKKVFKTVYIAIMVILALILAISTYRNLFYTQFVVSGSSMNPTLYDSDYGYTLKVDEKSALKKIKRFDIITFKHDVDGVNEGIIKRVIGLPGETIYFDYEANLYVNNELIEQNFIEEDLRKHTLNGASFPNEIYHPYIAYSEIEVPEDNYFVLGDNRLNSRDSLHRLGFVPAEEINGIVKVVLGTCTVSGEDDNKKITSRTFTGFKFF